MFHRPGLVIAAALAQASFLANGMRCGTYIAPDLINEHERDFKLHLIPPLLGDLDAEAMTNVNVHWHVIRQDTTLKGGDILDSQISDQITVLNHDYGKAGLNFVLASTTRTTNEDWFQNAGPGTSQSNDMKTALRKGGPADLNIYTSGLSGVGIAGILGYSTFPADYNANPPNDGVVVLYSSLPGGTTKNYNKGQTMTHEVGHWVGLYHTFEGGCSGDGDFVDDTARSRAPPRDVLRVAARVQAVRMTHSSIPSDNYMDYSYDACMTEFTPGQINRLKGQLSTYRGFV